MPSPSIRGHVMAMIQLAVTLLVILGELGSGARAILWTRAFETELANTSFGGVHLCVANVNQSASIIAVDTYSVPSLSLPGMSYTVRFQFALYVLGCGLPQGEGGAQGVYMYLRVYLLSEINWSEICANTRNLTVYLGWSGGGNETYVAQPCNYTADSSTPQLTAWLLVTYSADWSPDWVNRTGDYSKGGGAATVILRSDTDSKQNATWTNVVTRGLPANPMTPEQKALAALASVTTTTNWWLLICSVLNASRNLLVSASSQGSNETLESYMSCSTWTTLVYGAPTAKRENPTIVTQTSGYWGRELRRQLTTQSFGGIAYCLIASNTSILVTAADDVVASPGGAIVRGAFSAQLTPCSTSTSLALGDAYLKIFLRSDANWTDVCANSFNLVITVNLPSRTAVQFRPCPQSDAADGTATSTKAAWCILTLNASGEVELQWVSRETAGLVEANAVSVSFRVFGETNGTTLQWGNVLVTGMTASDPVDGIVQALKMVETTYWPVICQLVNASADRFLAIEITGSGNSSGNSSRTVYLYGNCSFASELSISPPPIGNITTGEGSITTPGFSSTETFTPTPTQTLVPSTTARPTTTTITPTTTMTSTTTTSTTRPITNAPTTTQTTTTPTTTQTTSTPTTTTPTTTRTTTTPTTITTPTTSTRPTTATIAATTKTTPTTASTTTAIAITPGVRSGGAESVTPDVATTLSADALLAIQNKQNLAAVVAQKNSDELRTQIAVVAAALLVLLVLSTVGLCKMVLPRAA